MALFQSAVLRKYLKQQDAGALAAAYATFTAHFHDAAIQANIREAKEEQYQEGFLRDLFVNVLGYTLNPQKGYELTSEFKNEKGSKKADGAILENGKALAVIELKGTDTTDLATINSQAFNYKANHTHCVYVVTSNFQKLRFFIDNAVDHLEFDLFALNADDFALLWLCLQRDNLLAGLPKKVKAESLQEEEQVTKRLYKDYSSFKNALWQDLCSNHPEHDQLQLYKKTQKLLDRFLFVLFSEDKGLLPPNSIREITIQWEKLKDLDAYVPLYDRFQKYFGYLNTGHKGKHHDIFAYNGGLFKPDELLDNVRITDAVLHPHVLTLSKYDFGTEVDVNILGHIFEHSLNEIENVTAQLEGRAVDTKKSKRKKDGVFYTPKYITKYIVENTVGRLCTEQKDFLGVVDEEYAKGRKGRKKKTIEELDTKLDVYRDWLLSLTICDPACGSGAFLNQALDYLIAEHRYVDELQATLLGHSITFKDIGDHILERNIYGVDINEESVDIARLSLWLRTATKGRKLNDLSSNIKCGNSLIDDPAVAGDKAFDWKKEFPHVFAKGGFDVVVGNPPYGSNVDMGKAYFTEHYHSAEGQFEIYKFFIEKSLTLLRDRGLLGFITPDTWTNLGYFQKLRKIMLTQYFIESCTTTLFGVFEDAVVDTNIFIVRNEKRDLIQEEFLVIRSDLSSSFTGTIRVIDGDLIPNFKSFDSIIDKLDRSTRKFSDISEIWRGMSAYGAKNPERPYNSNTKDSDLHRKMLNGGDIGRYLVKWSGEYIKYGEWLHRPRPEYIYSKPKILVQRIRNPKLKQRIVSVFDEEGYISSDGLSNLLIKSDSPTSIETIQALLNSKLINYWFGYYYFDVNIKPDQLREIPLPKHDGGTELTLAVRNMLETNKLISDVISSFGTLLQSKYTLPKLTRKLENWPTLDFKGFLKELKKAKVQLTLAEEAEWMTYFNEQKAKATALQQQIDATDKQIDALVYELYGLTEEEVRVVEGR